MRARRDYNSERAVALLVQHKLVQSTASFLDDVRRLARLGVRGMAAINELRLDRL